MDKDENKKAWEKPWSTDEIRDHSANWNLAGDSGLLNHLKQFSQDLLKSTHATEVAIDKLVEETKTTATQIENVTNTFLSLANTQFVENRVYDDDEKETPPEEKRVEEKEKSKEEQEAEIVDRVREALRIGMSILDTHFETVEVPASDSEDEESSASVGRLVLKARNLYTVRPLPYLIGSKEFMEDDRVGLGDISSDTEESPDQNIVQSSESDDEMEQDEVPVVPKMPRRISSSSDSENSEPESDRGGAVIKTKKQRTGSSTLGSVGAVEEEGDIFGRESPPEADVAAAVKNDVTRELAAKLGGVSTHKEEAPVQDNLFIPPSDPDDSSLFGGYTADKFKGGGGLFDDLDDWNDTSNSLWKKNEKQASGPTPHSKTSKDVVKNETKSEKPKPKPLESSLFGGDLFNDDQNEGDMFSTSKTNPSSSKRISELKVPVEKTSTPETLKKGLFEENEDDDDDDDDDLFESKPKAKSSGSAQGLKGSSLFDKVADEEDLFAVNSSASASESSRAKKKPAGGVSVFGGVNLFGDLSPIMQQSSSENVNPSNVNMTTDSSGIATISQEQSVSQKEGPKLSLFGADGDEMSFPSPVAASTMKSGLFSEVNNSDSLFGKPKQDEHVEHSTASVRKSSHSSLGAKAKKTVSLFDDSDSGDDELLFSSTSSTSSRSRRSQASVDILAAPVDKKPLFKKQLADNLFGDSVNNEPGFHIFGSQTSAKTTNTNSEHGDKSKNKDNQSTTTVEAKKDAYKLFDGVDDIDDIFAVPKEKDRAKTKDLHGDLFASSSNDGDDIFSQSKSVRSNSGTGSNALPGSEVTKEDIFSGVSKKDSPINKKPVHTDVQTITSVNLREPQVKPKIQNTKSTPEAEPTKPAEISVKSEVKSLDLLPDTSEVASDMSEAKLIRSDEKLKIADGHISEPVSTAKPPVSQKPKIVTKKPTVDSNDNHKSLANLEPNIEKKSPEKLRESPRRPMSRPREATSQDFQDSIRKDLESISKPEPPKTLNIRKTTDVLFESSSNGDDELFDTSWSNMLSDEKTNTDQNAHHNSALSSSTLGALLEDYDTGSCADSNPPRTAEGLGATEETDKASPKCVKSSETSPQKLSPLKFMIDPRALLPGAKPPSQSKQRDGAVSFDKPAETTSTLQSVGKARAKIQVKRRPPTRKARQEALRASSADYDNVDAALISQIPNRKDTYSNHLQNGSIVENNNVAPEMKSSETVNTFPSKPMNDQLKEEFRENQNLSSPLDSPVSLFDDISFNIKSNPSKFLDGNSNPLSPSTDEEDLFAVPQEIAGEDANKEPSEDGKSLFGGAPVLSPVDKEPPASFTDEKDPLYASLTKAFDANAQTNETRQPAMPSDILQNVAFAHQLPSSNVIPEQNTTTEEKGANSSKHTNNNYCSGDDDGGVVGGDNGDYDDDDDDLFSSKRKARIGGKKSKNAPLFSPEESLFPSKNSGLFATGKTKQNLFSPSESDSDDLFSFASKSVIRKQSVTEDVDKASVKPEIDDRDNIFALSKAQHRPLFQNTKQEITKPTSNPAGPSLSVVRSQKKDVNTLFGDDSPESDLFSASAKVTEKKDSNASGARMKMSGSGSLFDDTEDDHIFSSSSNKKNKPLFGDHSRSSKPDLSTGSGDAHSEDLFASCPPSKKSGPTSTKHQTVHRIETKEEPFEDPLMAMKK